MSTDYSFFNYRSILTIDCDDCHLGGDLRGNDSRVPTKEVSMLMPTVSTPTTGGSRKEGPQE